jgi:hypothetical protein
MIRLLVLTFWWSDFTPSGSVRFLSPVVCLVVLLVSCIFVVELRFLLHVQHKLQRFLVNGFHLMSINAYRDVLHATQKYNNAVWPCDSVFVVFYSVVEICYTCVQCNTFCYVYHSTHKCVLHMYDTVAVNNGRQLSPLLRRWVHVMAEGRRW